MHSARNRSERSVVRGYGIHLESPPNGIQTDSGSTGIRATAGRVGMGREWELWLTHYRETTGRTQVRGTASARRAFTARRAEGCSLAELKLATVGCHSDKWLREHAHDVPDTILRASNITRYIELGRQVQPTACRRVAPDGPVSADALAAWEQARGRLALPESAVRTWIEPLECVGAQGSTLYLAAPEGIRAWVQRRYPQLIREALQGTGYSEVEFVGQAVSER